jgi:hypothetical protein
MPVEASIDADDDWFVGESKVLRFTVANGAGISGWELRWRLIDRKGVVVMEKLSTANEIVATDQADPPLYLADVQVASDDYDDSPAGNYQFTLWRIDAGNEALLSYGSAVLRSDGDA